MDYFQAIILASVQGITEWLPISSSGHLAIMQHFLGLTENIGYDVILHFASLIAIFIVFYEDIKSYLRDKRFVRMIIIGTIPIALVGFFLSDYIQSIFNNLLLVGVMLIFTSVILFFSDKVILKTKLDGKSSLVIGLFQAMAIMPGISRSGATISSALMMGIKKDDAIKFSFILVIPAIFGAMILNLGEVSMISSSMIVGFILCIIISYVSLKWLIKLIKNNKFKYFSYYCFILGLLIIGGVLK